MGNQPEGKQTHINPDSLSSEMWRLPQGWELGKKRTFPKQALKRMRGMFIEIRPTDHQLDLLRLTPIPEKEQLETDVDKKANEGAIPLTGIIIPPKETSSDRNLS